MDIKTREELINALMDAAELEHNLTCLYLFAMFSMKYGVDELNGVPASDHAQVLAKLNQWKASIRVIAFQEMGHLGTVCNLLTLLGAEPHFDRPNFPPPEEFYPTTENFVLERFGRGFLSRVVEFERNEDQPGVEFFGLAPINIPYEHVGELYAAILKAFETPANGGIPFADNELFLGPSEALDAQIWSGNVEIHTGLDPASGLPTREQIRNALKDVIEEGEGAGAAPGQQSHYQRFFKIAEELKELLDDYPPFDPARNVLANPMVGRHRNHGTGYNLIDILDSRDVAELSNSVYGSLLLVLRQYYLFAGELPSQRMLLQSLAIMMMKRLVLPLGEILTLLPARTDAPEKRAGAGFEIYRPMYASSRPKSAWRLIRERLQLAEVEAGRLKVITWPQANVAIMLGSVQSALTTFRQALEDEIPNLPG